MLAFKISVRYSATCKQPNHSGVLFEFQKVKMSPKIPYGCALC